MTMRRLGIFGCGAIAELFYKPALLKLRRQGWSIACFDQDLGRARAYAAELKADAFASRSTAPPALVLDAAIVATPPASHTALVEELLVGGTHVLCEKPFVLHPQEGHRLVRLADERRLVLAVNQTRRFHPNARLAREIIASGGLGRVERIEVREGLKFNWPTRTGFHFLATAQRSGILSDQGSHIFDQLAWMIGERLEPLAVVTDGYAGPEASACVDFAAGSATGTAVLTWLMKLPTRTHLRCAQGSIVLDDNWNRILLEDAAGLRTVWAKDRATSPATFGLRVVSDFLAGAQDGGSPAASASSVMPSIEFLDEAYHAARAAWPLVASPDGEPA